MVLFGLTLDDLYRAFLVMFRTAALIMTVPVFGHVSIPKMLRVWLIILIAVLMLPVSSLAEIQPPPTMGHLLLVIASEIFIGFAMGFAVVLVFSAVQFAGHMIGVQMGLAVANVIDPMSSVQISVIGQMYYLVSLVLFLMINGHHMVISALVRSFEMIPVGGAIMTPGLQMLLIDLSYMVFVVGIKLAAPVVITLYILNALLGIIARTVPQMNVFIVGFPLGISVGLFMIAVSFPFFYMLLDRAFRGVEPTLSNILRVLSG